MTSLVGHCLENTLIALLAYVLGGFSIKHFSLYPGRHIPETRLANSSSSRTKCTPTYTRAQAAA